MNPKQLACVILMAIIGSITYFGQIVHKKVQMAKEDAEAALDAAAASESARQTAEIQVKKTKFETEELRRFWKAWIPFSDKVQTQEEVDSAFELSLRDRNITLINSKKSDTRVRRDDKVLPKSVVSSIEIQDEYFKVMNWFGDIERRLPLARVNSCVITGGSSVSQVKLDLSVETPLVNLDAAKPAASKAKKTNKSGSSK